MKWLKRNRPCRVLFVEKTDRPYRNLRDAVTLEDLDIEIRLVKEGQVVQGVLRSKGPDGPALNSGTPTHITMMHGWKPFIPFEPSKK